MNESKFSSKSIVIIFTNFNIRKKKSPGNSYFLKQNKNKEIFLMSSAMKLKNMKIQNYFNLDNQLSSLRPIGKVDLEGISLATKFSNNFPENLITCDECGYVYLINSLEIELKKFDVCNNQPFSIKPKSKSDFNIWHF